MTEPGDLPIKECYYLLTRMRRCLKKTIYKLCIFLILSTKPSMLKGFYFFAKKTSDAELFLVENLLIS